VERFNVVPIFSIFVILYLGYLLLRHDCADRRFGGLAVNGQILECLRVLQPRAWINRRVGLLNHGVIPGDFGLWLSAVRTVHTVGMFDSIDIVFLSGAEVVDIRPMTPAGHRRIFSTAKCDAVLELKGGMASTYGITRGSQVHFIRHHVTEKDPA